MLEGVTTRLSDVVQRVRALLTPSALLVGHSLENDLNAMRMLHGRILDTVALYPHPKGLPSRCALRHLAAKCDSAAVVTRTSATLPFTPVHLSVMHMLVRETVWANWCTHELRACIVCVCAVCMPS